MVNEKNLTNGINTISFHEARDIVNKTIEDYLSSVNDSGEKFPETRFDSIEDSNSVSFEYLNRNASFSMLQYIIKRNSGRLDDAQISTSFSDAFDIKTKSGIFARIDSSHFSGEFRNVGMISVSKKGLFTSGDIETIVQLYKMGNPLDEAKDDPKKALSSLGVTVYDSNSGFSWDYIAGYDEVKDEIRSSVILPLKNPEVYENISRNTRKVYESSRPKAVLFEGPPGTGKTTMARIIAKEVNAPLIYVPIESIMTKWYGESERNLSNIFDYAHELGDNILFFDEIDSLATSRDSNMHEATRRVLSVLLRKIDGFNAMEKSIVVGATNRKYDLDSALLSRFDMSINFPLPNESERASIFSNYAQKLNSDDLLNLSRESEGLSGRNIKDICEHAERRWASRLISGSVTEVTPICEEYLSAIRFRQKNIYNGK